MSNFRPFCKCTGVSGIITASVVESHNANTATATIEAESTTLMIGNYITINMGYYDGTSDVVFRGYVKQIERKTPTSAVTITANDIMVRAIEYFIAPSNPDATYKRKKIQAETLIADLLGMCGLSLTGYSTSYFTLANTGELEVNLTTVYDYCKAVSDLLTWSVWADRKGNIYFKNRKPFPMTGTSGQPGDVADTYINFFPDSTNTINLEYSVNDKDLRNRIVVYGSGTQATASVSSPYLPSGFYKTAVIGAELMLDDQAACQDTADYNLALYNRLTKSMSMTVIGDCILEARKCINISSIDFPDASYIQSGNWYIYSCTHSFSTSGYLCSLELRIQ